MHWETELSDGASGVLDVDLVGPVRLSRGGASSRFFFSTFRRFLAFVEHE